MVQPGYSGALDTPRTNIGDATYLSRAPDFADISQEASFQSPEKDDNVLQQLRNGGRRGINLRTPRRDPLTDRRNLPLSVGGAEFTPLLKSATRNSTRRRGKENGATSGLQTPGLGRIDEGDITALPRMDNSIFSSSRNQSYMDHTSLPQVDSSSVASTPLAMPRRTGIDKGPLQDGNQLSLREQENVIDRVEKENFGLKLKIHFLEDALRKAGPGYSEAALKENTELKVDKVTMQRELHRYKKHVSTFEKEIDSYRQQIEELQDSANRQTTDHSAHEAAQTLRHELENKEEDIRHLQRQLAEAQQDQENADRLRDTVEDLEAEVREKDRQLTQREDELEDARDKLEEAEEKVRKASQSEDHSDELEEAKDTIQDLEGTIRRLEEEAEDLKEKATEASTEKQRAERDLEELQEDLADKSLVTKGLSRQIEEKVARLQDELDKAGKEYASLETELTEVNQENEDLRAAVENLEQARVSDGQLDATLQARVEELELALVSHAEEKNALQIRNDTLTGESRTLQEDIQRLEHEVEEFDAAIAKEKDFAVEIEKDLRVQYADEIERLNDEISDLQAEVREKDNLYDNDSEKWENEKQALEAERERAEGKVTGLERTIERLRQTEGSLSDRESKVQQAMQSEVERHRSEEAVMTRQVDDLQDALETRQTLLSTLRNELSAVRDELRQTQIDYQTQVNKAAGLTEELDAARSARNNNSVGSNRSELDAAKRESEKLRDELRLLRLANETSQLLRNDGAASFIGQRTAAAASPSKLKAELSSANNSLQRVTAERASLQNELAVVRAERDELNSALQRTSLKDNDTLRVDQERLELRTTKLKLDNEVRRLKEENKALSDQRDGAEKTLEEEIEKAAAEEERLSQEILQLQSKLRQSSSSETTDGASTRRTIRDLERRIEDYEAQLAAAGSGEGDLTGDVSIIRRDLSAARQKELEFLQRESSHRELVKNLRREIAAMESKLHDGQISKLTESPRKDSSDDAAIIQSEYMSIIEDLQCELNDAEDQKLVLEEVLEETRQQAEEAATDHERTVQRLWHEIEKATRERDFALESVSASDSNKDKKARHLRKSQVEIENLEHDVIQQQQMLDALTETEAALRHKLERVRAERGAFRMSAEKLQRQLLRSQSTAEHERLRSANGEAERALETVVRAADGAKERHQKEVKGMVLQMGWMQARWEREAALRADAAFAKGFVQLQLDIANACNKAQLRELEHIRTNLLGNRQVLARATKPHMNKPNLRTFLVMARFIARTKIAARAWSSQETVRQKLVAATQETKKEKRSRRLRVVEVDA